MPRRTLLVGFAALLLPVAACSSSGSGGSSASSGLAAAMDSVSGTGPAAEYFEYGNLAALRKLGVVHADAATSGSGTLYDQRWGAVAGVGASDLSPYTAILPKTFDLNLLAGDTAVTIGYPPNRASRIDGAWHSKGISTKLTSLGAKPRSFDGTAGLSFGPDNAVDASSQLDPAKYGALSLVLGQLVVNDQSFATGRNAATLENVLAAGSKSLLDTEHFADLAGCLGDVVAAIVLAPLHPGNSTLVAVGVRTPTAASGAVDDVLCVLPKSGGQDAVHTSLAQHLALGAADPLTQRPISSYLSKSAVDDTGDLVRAVLTVKSTTPAGYLLQALEANSVSYWDGSCTAADLAHRSC